jgi:hypothetical protein
MLPPANLGEGINLGVTLLAPFVLGLATLRIIDRGKTRPAVLGRTRLRLSVPLVFWKPPLGGSGAGQSRP